MEEVRGDKMGKNTFLSLSFLVHRHLPLWGPPTKTTERVLGRCVRPKKTLQLEKRVEGKLQWGERGHNFLLCQPHCLNGGAGWGKGKEEKVFIPPPAQFLFSPLLSPQNCSMCAWAKTAHLHHLGRVSLSTFALLIPSPSWDS